MGVVLGNDVLGTGVRANAGGADRDAVLADASGGAAALPAGAMAGGQAWAVAAGGLALFYLAEFMNTVNGQPRRFSSGQAARR